MWWFIQIHENGFWGLFGQSRTIFVELKLNCVAKYQDADN